MRFALNTFLPLLAATAAFAWQRIDKNNVALLIIDHQVGLFNIVRDFSAAEFKNNVLANAALGKIFNLPTIITTSSETGPNGPVPKEILQMHPNATYVRREGEVNAWDSSAFRAAVKSTKKKQVIVSGITTDVCVTFVALSLIDAGYEVFVNADASGTFDARTADLANAQMRAAGVQVLSSFAISADLMRDWRNTPGFVEMLPYYDQYLPIYGAVARAHAHAVLNGTAGPINEGLITP